MTKTSNCILCESLDTFDFFQLPPVPTQDGVMCSSEIAAKNVDKGIINLRFCQHCGFIQNEGYDPNKISFDNYDFSNDRSPLFSAYVNELSDRLIKQYNLKGKTIIDIGSGDGVFLKTICEKGGNKGIGIDPGFDLKKIKASTKAEVSFVRDYYSEKHHDLKPDFITCRLVIDLLEDQSKFLRMLRNNLENCPSTIVYFEVPNAIYTFEDRIIWNVVYEHGAWYTPDSFAYQFELCGFEVLNVAPCWNDEFLGIEARPKPLSKEVTLPNSKKIKLLSKTIHDFNSDFQKIISECKARIEDIKKNKTKTIAWGAGARAVTFFNLFDIKKEVPYIIDINDKRHDKYLPGSGQKIVGPKFILDFNPNLVIITNPTYAKEIKADIFKLGLNPDFWIL
jgi:methyltransferase family protein/C-methyltransferase-like protein